MGDYLCAQGPCVNRGPGEDKSPFAQIVDLYTMNLFNVLFLYIEQSGTRWPWIEQGGPESNKAQVVQYNQKNSLRIEPRTGLFNKLFCIYWTRGPWIEQGPSCSIDKDSLLNKDPLLSIEQGGPELYKAQVVQ